MQDKKIEEILENYMAEEVNSYPKEAIEIFGFRFITKMSKIYENKEELIFHLAEAIDLFKELCIDENDVNDMEEEFDEMGPDVAIIYTNITNNELQQDILFSFRMQPELNLMDRLTYIKALMLTKYLYEDIENNEEKIGRKLIFWYQFQPFEGDIEIAKKAIEDQVFGQIIKNTKVKERQKKIS